MADIILPFFAEAAGETIVIAGVTYRVGRVNSSGHLLTEVQVSALPTGAATLAEQQTQTTALQLIDDLRAALDSVGTDALIVSDELQSDDIRVANKNYTAAQTNNELIAAPGSGKAIYIVEIIYSTDAANNFKLVSKTASPATKFGPHYFPADGGMAPGRLGAPIKLPDNENLGFTSVGVANHTITVIAKVK